MAKKYLIPKLPQKPILRVQTKQFYINMDGLEIPAENMSELAILRDYVATQLVEMAKQYRHALQAFKLHAFSILHQYKKRYASINNTVISSGGVTVTSFDGTMKVETFWHDFTTFSEGLKQAKELMSLVITEKLQNNDKIIQRIFTEAFSFNRDQISVTKILSLCQYQVDDDRWRQAVEIIRSDMVRASRKQYIRFQERQKGGAWETIYIDISKVPIDMEKVQ